MNRSRYIFPIRPLRVCLLAYPEHVQKSWGFLFFGKGNLVRGFQPKKTGLPFFYDRPTPTG